MSEFDHRNYYERNAFSPVVRKERFLSTVHAYAESPNETNSLQGAMFSAFLALYPALKELEVEIDEFLIVRTDMTPTQQCNMLRSSIQKEALRNHLKTYPHDFDDDAWINVITGLVGNPDSRREMRYDLHNRHLQTNIPDRYKSVSIAANWLRANGRLGEHAYIMDFGCSRNLGLKALAFVQNQEVLNHKFGATVFVDPVDLTDITHSREINANEPLTKAVNKIQNQPFGLRIGIGIDACDLNDPLSREWARANLAPREFEDGTIYTWDLLDTAYNERGPNITPTIAFQQNNVLDYNKGFLFGATPEDNQLYDIVSIVTVLNQMSGEQRYKLIKQARRYTKKTGLVLIQDFARPMDDLSWNLEFLDENWNERYSYRTILIDMMEPKGFQEVMLWDGGRAKKLHIPVGSAAIAAANGTEPIDLRSFLLSSM